MILNPPSLLIMLSVYLQKINANAKFVAYFIEDGFDQDLNLEYGFYNDQFSDAKFYNETIVLSSISRYDMAQTVYKVGTSSRALMMTVNTAGISANIADYSNIIDYQGALTNILSDYPDSVLYTAY